MSSRFYSNAGFLLLLQISSYIFPLLLIPYLTRVLGISLYGVVAFALATAQLLCIITDFGFNLSATRQIAENHNNRDRVRRIIASVFVSKILLLVPVVIILCLLIYGQQEKYGDYSTLFWLLLIPVIGQTFQPIWFFQGIERMAFITVFIVVARALYILLVIALVASAHDVNWVILSNGISQIIAATIALFFMCRLGYRPLWPGWHYVRLVFSESIQFFWSRLAVSIYTIGGVFYLGLISTSVNVAIYSAAEQLYRGGQSLLQPISQAMYPYMARTKDVVFFKKVLIAIFLLCMVGLFFGFIVSGWVVIFIFGSEFIESVSVLNLFLLTLSVTSISIMLGYPLLGVFGFSSAANKSVIYAGLIQLLLLAMLWFMNLDSAFIVAVTVLVVEIFVLVYRVHYAKKIL